MKKNTKIIILSIILILIAIFNFGYFTSVRADMADEIRQSIESHSDKIRQLEEEIKTYEKQIATTNSEANSLQNAIKILDINQKKINAEITKTETDIKKTNLVIQNLSGEIGDINVKVNSNTGIIEKTLREIDRTDRESFVEQFLANESLAEILDQYQRNIQFQEKIRNQSKELAEHKINLEDKKTSTEKEKNKLILLNSELKDQNQILASNKKDKNNLLAITKNKETEYKRILAERQAEKERFERELFDFESELKRVVDPKSYPKADKGILSFPLDNVFVTQPFGKTVDSKRLYVSGTHNGVDFRASRGTPVKAALLGIVQGVGNTDEQKGCYSYGKWILIKHPNGLSTLYAHLDLIKASVGQSVSTGEVIGYSGQTGYSTGPHLHFTLYASQGVEIQRYSSSRNCKNVNIPIAPSNAYLDPMLYF